jgi:hypothetical protein
LAVAVVVVLKILLHQQLVQDNQEVQVVVWVETLAAHHLQVVQELQVKEIQAAEIKLTLEEVTVVEVQVLLVQLKQETVVPVLQVVMEP